MEFQTCKACGKKMIMSRCSNSEVRRAKMQIPLCVCPENNSPADIKIILGMQEPDGNRS